MNRRGFLGSLIALAVAPFAPKPAATSIIGIDWGVEPSQAVIGTYGAIERASFSWWRNYPPADWENPALRQALHDAYDSCR